jgi:hypothetical protein
LAKIEHHQQGDNVKNESLPCSPHTFHIPVMGTGFTIDTPLRVARYGISSVVSLVDDVLIEQMRRFHSEREGEPFEGISEKTEDARARRITAYLDLLDRVVARQTEELRATPFVSGSEITRYYELLPESPLKLTYRQMLETADPTVKTRLQAALRRAVVAGSIDVNIMTKLDRERFRGRQRLSPEQSDALSALRGYARSTLRSSVVFSAGLNPRLYTYAGEFEDFFPDARGDFGKRIILKVSDFRSALVQGKFLATRGLWVSEFRIESGLNCGGHAFASQGHLLGPVLDEFRQCKHDLPIQMYPLYAKALEGLGRSPSERPHPIRITVQGGIGTFEEDQLLVTRYEVDGTGWGTPFLLVPEVTNVDEEHLHKLLEATDEDVYLSDSSPFGIPFWNLRNSASEISRQARIQSGRPGSTCPTGFLCIYNTEFTETPICIASRAYQRPKLASLEQAELTPQQREATKESVLAKSCICHDLAGAATRKHGIDLQATPAICCGPNIVNFSKLATLDEMVGHIYGRLSLLTNPQRPHMFVRELMLYIDYLGKELDNCSQGIEKRAAKYFSQFRENLLCGIEHYRQVAERLAEEQKTDFLSALQTLQEVVKRMPLELHAAV